MEKSAPIALKRLFVAIPLPIALANTLLELLPDADSSIRALPAQNLHLTLRFIGDAPVKPIMERLAAIEFNAFELLLGQPGYFRGKHQNCSIWLGVESKLPLIELHRNIQQALLPLGLNSDTKQFRPHITLARGRGRLTSQWLESLKDGYAQFQSHADKLSLNVDTFCLYSSVLTATGSRYTCEQSVNSQ